ncbi:MAG TPA: nucleoside deaminase [Nevskiaceae bacterium]|nr:nucleoside deaminase [Nevskiaceae bacterium]
MRIEATQKEPLASLPPWVSDAVDMDARYETDDACIALAIDLSRRNVEHDTGGPFGSAVFDDAGRIVALGVNQVVPLGTSLAHGEIVALMGAQVTLGRARLNADGRRYTLATNAQPCCQCYGAIVWAGIDKLLIGARSSDTESLAGFDEGPLPSDWTGELEKRGIHVVRDLHREEARAVLDQYRKKGGECY